MDGVSIPIIPSNTISSEAFAGSRFAFGFPSNEADPATVEGAVDDALSSAKRRRGPAPPPPVPRARSDSSSRPAHIPVGLLARTRHGQYVRIDWERSSSSAEICASGQYYAAADLEFLDDPLSSIHTNDLWLIDTVRENGSTLCHDPSLLHYAHHPLSIEPGLAPLAWPLRTDAFLALVYNRRAWVVHAHRHRLHRVQAELAELEIDALIGAATRTVAWLRDGPTIQYVDVGTDAALARALYRAGHSLYFNPDLDLQRRYVQAVAADLGLDVAAGVGGDLGGDVEVFAVRGQHRTPWHYDAQQNFTIQLSGTKRWSIRRAPITDPISNLHPRSSNREAFLDDLCVHGATVGESIVVPDNDDDDGVQHFTLRPGSILYLPAGWWHRVEQTDPETPSLSINLSIDGSRWADLVTGRLLPMLWASPAWRARPDFRHGLDSARAHLQSMLNAFSASISSLKAEDLLPDGFLLGSRPTTADSVLRLSQFDDRDDVARTATYRRSPVVHLIELLPTGGRPDPADDGVRFRIVSGFARYADGVKPEFALTIVVPNVIVETARRLILPGHEVVVPERFTADMNAAEMVLFQQMLNVLVHHSYLIAV